MRDNSETSNPVSDNYTRFYRVRKELSRPPLSSVVRSDRGTTNEKGSHDVPPTSSLSYNSNNNPY